MTERAEKIARVLIEVYEDQQKIKYSCKITEKTEEKTEEETA